MKLAPDAVSNVCSKMDTGGIMSTVTSSTTETDTTFFTAEEMPDSVVSVVTEAKVSTSKGVFPETTSTRSTDMAANSSAWKDDALHPRASNEVMAASTRRRCI